MSDDEVLTDDQKLEIAAYFIRSSPTGEVDEVVKDVKTLLGGGSGVLNDTALSAILKDYNVAQMTAAADPDGKKVLVTAHGMVKDDEFVDPASGMVLKFNHLNRTFSAHTGDKVKLAADVETSRAALQDVMEQYAKTSFKKDKCTAAVYGTKDGDMSICVSACNIHLGNFWTGGWRSVYSLNTSTPGTTAITGNVNVNVHYFEDGNVQLHGALEKKLTVEVTADVKETAKAVMSAIQALETTYQTSMEAMFVRVHEKTFKAMRRILPVDKQRMKWNVAAHRMAGELTGKPK